MTQTKRRRSWFFIIQTWCEIGDVQPSRGNSEFKILLAFLCWQDIASKMNARGAWHSEVQDKTVFHGLSTYEHFSKLEVSCIELLSVSMLTIREWAALWWLGFVAFFFTELSSRGNQYS